MTTYQFRKAVVAAWKEHQQRVVEGRPCQATEQQHRGPGDQSRQRRHQEPAPADLLEQGQDSHGQPTADQRDDRVDVKRSAIEAAQSERIDAQVGQRHVQTRQQGRDQHGATNATDGTQAPVCGCAAKGTLEEHTRNQRANAGRRGQERNQRQSGSGRQVEVRQVQTERPLSDVQNDGQRASDGQKYDDLAPQVRTCC